MFVRQTGRRFLLLHSYREGGSRVCQLALHRFDGVGEVVEALEPRGWRALRGKVEGQFPHLVLDWDGLRGRLTRLLERLQEAGGPEERVRAGLESGKRATERVTPLVESGKDAGRALELRRAIRRLRRLVSEAEPEVLRLAGSDLHELGQRLAESVPVEAEGVESELAASAALEEEDPKAAQGRLRRAQRLRPWDGGLWRLEAELLARHRRWKGAEKAYRAAARLDWHPEVRPYLQDLEGLALVLERRGLWEQACEVLQERVRVCPEPASREALGAALHRAGQFEQARQQFRRLPDCDWRRHYHEAVTWLEQGAALAGLGVLLRAIARNDWPACTLLPRLRGGPRVSQPDTEYWEQFGDLWSEEARCFLRAVREDRTVRVWITQLYKRRHRVRKVMPLYVMRPVARRALARIVSSA
jgi:tetratricopeptide (TPR) repeat protein